MNERLLLIPLLAVLGAAAAQAGPPTVARAAYAGHPAYRLTDGKTEAIVVPALSGRVMRYGAVGGPNQLWNGNPGQAKPGEWRNWGGEKVWPALQSLWPLFTPGGWPPHATWDQAPHRAQILPGGVLRTVGPVMAGWGARQIRTYRIDPATGDFVVSTTFRKERGEPRQMAVWNVVQIPQPEAIFVRLNPDSTYRNGYHWFGGKAPGEGRVEVLDSGLARYLPSPTGGFKFGADSPLCAAVAVRNGVALRLRAKKVAGGAYPEGADGNGFPVTVWNGGAARPAERYNEVETMSPLTNLKVGQSLTHTLRFSLHRVPAGSAPEAAAALLK